MFVFIVLLLSLINVSYSFKFNTISSSSLTINKKLHASAIDSITTIDPDFHLSLGAFTVSLALSSLGNIPVIKNDNGFNLPGRLIGGASFFFGIFGAFFAYQAISLRFQYDSTSFSLVKASGESLGENVVVG